MRAVMLPLVLGLAFAISACVQRRPHRPAPNSSETVFANDAYFRAGKVGKNPEVKKADRPVRPAPKSDETSFAPEVSPQPTKTATGERITFATRSRKPMGDAELQKEKEEMAGRVDSLSNTDAEALCFSLNLIPRDEVFDKVNVKGRVKKYINSLKTAAELNDVENAFNHLDRHH